jgi:hypothetical protein
MVDSFQRRLELARNFTGDARCFGYALFIAGVYPDIRDFGIPNAGFFRNSNNFEKVVSPRAGCIVAFVDLEDEIYTHMGVVDGIENAQIIHWKATRGLCVEDLSGVLNCPFHQCSGKSVEYWKYCPTA